MRRFFLITGAMIVLMIMPQATVWAEEEFTPAQMKQIRKMFEEWSKQQRQKQRPPAAGGPAIAAPSPPPKMRSTIPTMGDTTKQSIRYGQ